MESDLDWNALLKADEDAFVRNVRALASKVCLCSGLGANNGQLHLILARNALQRAECAAAKEREEEVKPGSLILENGRPSGPLPGSLYVFARSLSSRACVSHTVCLFAGRSPVMRCGAHRVAL